MENNFKCTSCNHEFFVTRYSFKITEGENVYIIPKTGQLVGCPKCLQTSILFIEKKGEHSNVLYGKFSSASLEEKKRILGTRAKTNNKKTEDQYRTIDREFRGITNPKHY